MRGRRVRTGLLGRDQRPLGRANIVRSLLADHPAHGFAAFSAVYRCGMVPVNLRRGASARRDGVVHFRRIEAPTYADDHANDLQRFATDCQSPCNSRARRRPVAVSCRSRNRPDLPPQAGEDQHPHPQSSQRVILGLVPRIPVLDPRGPTTNFPEQPTEILGTSPRMTPVLKPGFRTIHAPDWGITSCRPQHIQGTARLDCRIERSAPSPPPLT